MYDPSGRRISFFVLTITAVATCPFLTFPEGIALFTVTTILSPIEALFLLVPPNTRIHNTSFAPLLSATESLDSCRIISNDYFALSIISTNLQFFVLDKGLHSRTRTVSPMLQSFFSSWATNLEDFLMNLPYFGCFTFLSTVITMDLSIKLLVTTPTLSFLIKT